jgi:hypothetical protein
VLNDICFRFDNKAFFSVTKQRKCDKSIIKMDIIEIMKFNYLRLSHMSNIPVMLLIMYTLFKI